MHRLRPECGSCGAHFPTERQWACSLRHGRPADDLEPAVRVLGDSRATFHPVSAIDVPNAGCLVNRRMMNVTADDAVDAMTLSFRSQRAFEFADEIHGILDLQFRPFRQRPIRESE